MYTFDFSVALNALRQGKRIARKGWNGKDMYLYLVPGSEFETNREPLLSLLGRDTLVEYRSHIDMRTAQGDHVPWVASQSDLLGQDWFDLDA